MEMILLMVVSRFSFLVSAMYDPKEIVQFKYKVKWLFYIMVKIRL